MQAILYRDSPYIVMYYGATLEGYRTDRVTGFTPQPADTATTKGDLLATYGPFSFISIRPAVGAPSGSSAKGASAGIWIAIALAVLVLGAVLVLMRRRRTVDDEERA
jgi:hypothetical protein